MQKTVKIWNIETGEEKEMQDFHAAFVLRVNQAWTSSKPKPPPLPEPEITIEHEPEPEPKPIKKRGKK
jgi:hypothetical protein